MKTKKTKLARYKLKQLLSKATPRWLVLAIDLYLTLSTFVFVFILLRILRIITGLGFYQIVVFHLPLVFICVLTAFLLTSSYRRIIRFTGIKDLNKLLQTNLLYAVLLFVVYAVFYQFTSNPTYLYGKWLVPVHFLFNTLVLIFVRIVYKDIYDRFIVSKTEDRRILIFGAGEAGVIVYRVLTSSEKGRAKVVGFLDDNERKSGLRINGIPIYHSSAVTADFVEKHQIDEVIISIRNIRTTRLGEMIDQFSGLPLTLKIIPPVSRWLNNELTTKQIRPIQVEDLLGRTPIYLENEKIHHEFEDKVILVTGAAGSIGSEIARQLMTFPIQKLILLDQAESAMYELQQMTKQQAKDSCEFIVGDIRDVKRIEEVFKFFKPNIVFHAAAYKHVPLMEENPYESVRVNIGGTKIIADLANKYQIEKFVMISTDKAVNPTNVMGATKRVAELYVSCLNKLSNTQFIVTRFGNVLGSNGSVIPLFKKQIEAGGPVTVTHKDITRYFMTIPEACQLVLEAGVMGKGGEIFVFDMGKSVKIFDLAKKIIYLSGFRYPEDIDIKIIGLRPGEKIYEELLTDNETCIKTHHPKIMIARVNSPDEKMFMDQINHLVALESWENMDSVNTYYVTILKKLVPEYISQNSKFSEIDEENKANKLK
ncbi:MAG: nucleoside-diphosphate sugar epimerase/dehydratase [Weeksellaceae bacterium]|nr:nucleoside-diphosphate sugar epimerase/dehydratase [Weeksellaceae bacterium]